MIQCFDWKKPCTLSRKANNSKNGDDNTYKSKVLLTRQRNKQSFFIKEDEFCKKKDLHKNPALIVFKNVRILCVNL